MTYIYICLFINYHIIYIYLIIFYSHKMKIYYNKKFINISFNIFIFLIYYTIKKLIVYYKFFLKDLKKNDVKKIFKYLLVDTYILYEI